MSPHLWEMVSKVAFGSEHKTPDKCTTSELVERIEQGRTSAAALGVDGFSISFCSKIFHVFAPEKWPVLNVRANASVAQRRGLADVAEVTRPEDYAEYAKNCAALATEMNLPDLDFLDIAFSNAYEVDAGRRLHD